MYDVFGYTCLYIPGMCLCVKTAAAAAAAGVCVAILLLLRHLLLLPLVLVTVNQMAKTIYWFVESDSSVYFLFIQIRFILYLSLGSNIASTALIRP